MTLRVYPFLQVSLGLEDQTCTYFVYLRKSRFTKVYVLTSKVAFPPTNILLYIFVLPHTHLVGNGNSMQFFMGTVISRMSLTKL